MISICRSSILISRLSCLCCLVFFAAAPARAQEPLIFKPLSQHDKQAAITAYLGFDGTAIDPDKLEIADIDLNGDGLSEALIRQADGTIRILALPPRSAIVPLGTLRKSRGVSVSDAHDFGVRRLITRGSATNDFTQSTYAWNPRAQRYAPSD